MSTMINLGPMIAKVARDMLEEQNTIIDIEGVYAKLIETYGNQIFESERMLAQVAIRQKIKSHLRSAISVNGDEGADQLRLLKDDAPATLSVKMAEGGYAYVPLLMASVEHLDAATAAKKENIKHASAALKRWEKTIDPIRKLMVEKKVSFGEAKKLFDEQPKAAKAPKRARKAA